MSVKTFCRLLNEGKFGKNDKRFFPLWLRRYAQTVKQVGQPLLITEGEVIRFSRSLRDNGIPAWQRLQAVRAVEAYRNLVLKTDQPSLRDIRQKLGRIAAREQALGASGRLEIADERDLLADDFATYLSIARYGT